MTSLRLRVQGLGLHWFCFVFLGVWLRSRLREQSVLHTMPYLMTAATVTSLSDELWLGSCD